MANSTMVFGGNPIGNQTIDFRAKERSSEAITRCGSSASLGKKVDHNGDSNKLTTTGKKILDSALRSSSKKKYGTYWKQWNCFCSKNGIILASATNIVNFLGELYDRKMSYSTIKVAKSALGHVVELPPYRTIGDHPMIIKFMKGLFNLNPPRTKVGFVWDVKILFNYFESLPDNESLSEEDLSSKTLLLMLLLGGQRLNTMFNFRVNEMIINKVSVTFAPSVPLKHSRENRKGDVFEYRDYHIHKLCVVSATNTYLQRRKTKVSDSVHNLFITNKKPYRPASIDTLRRWVKNMFSKAGIINFSPHSCRAAATSKAEMVNVDLEEILKKACWSNAKTFHQHYKKDILSLEEMNNFQKILE